MARNKIIDYVTGFEVDGKPEEILAVQPFSKILVEDYHYPKHELQTHPQLLVKSCPSDPKGYPVDIAVFENKGTKNERLKMIVECKKPTRQDGREQLEIYLKFCDAQIGIWYNGKESLYLKKIERSGNITFEEIPAIPNYKETIDEIGKYITVMAERFRTATMSRLWSMETRLLHRHMSAGDMHLRAGIRHLTT